MNPPASTPRQPPRAASQPQAAAGPITQLSSLSGSLAQDLGRPELGPEGRRALLEVLAASVRHGHALSARLSLPDHRSLLLSVLPRQRLAHCAQPIDPLLTGNLAQWRVDEVLPAVVRAPGAALVPEGQPIEPPFAPLAPLLWAVALAGSRGDLLPELAGQAAYRVVPGAKLSGLFMPEGLPPCLERLRRNTCSLRQIASWDGVGLERAMRLLNALYLQSALIVSHTHPAATNEGWAGYGS